jgi:hypothetical protein
MYAQYELKFLIDRRHEGTLRVAQTRRQAKQVRANRRPCFGWAAADSEFSADTSLPSFIRVGIRRLSWRVGAKEVGKWTS